MKFTKMITENFQGLSGVRSFDLSEKIIVHIGKNGTGKTSFINALRYVLTGAEPEGEIITYGADRMSVTLFDENNVAFTRMKTRSAGNKCLINKKTTTAIAFNSAICGEISSKTLKIVSSSDIVSSMEPKEFKDFLLSFVSFVERDDIFKVTEELPEKAVEEIRHEFIDSRISMDQINTFYKNEYERRKELKKVLIDLKAKIDVLAARGAKNAAKRQRAEIEKELEAVKLLEKESIQIKEKIKNYEKTVGTRNKQITFIENIKKSLEGLKEVSFNPDELTKKEEDLKNLQAKKEQALKTESTYKTATVSLEKTLETLGKPVCPISEKLRCTTDKTEIENEIKDAIQNSKKACMQAVEEVNKITDEIKELTEIIEKIKEQKYLEVKKKELEEQLKKAKETLIVLPEKPEIKNNDDFSAKAELLQKELIHFDNYMEYIRCYQEYIKKREEYIWVDSIIVAFGAKGVVKEYITQSFIEKFEKACNSRANRFNGMTLRFTSDEKGINISADVNNDGTSISIKSLSGGETAKVLYVLMDIFTSISGFKLLFLDELTILDIDGLRTLLEIIKENQDNYDNIILNAVDYDDIKELLKDEGLVN